MMLRYLFLGLAVAVVAVVATAGLRGHHFTRPPFEIFPDMIYQDKVKDQQPNGFFADGVGDRELIPGTIAEEMPAVNDYWATGKWDTSHWGDGIPVHAARDGGRPLAVDEGNMARGRERYNISCAVCHGSAGDGQGIVTRYGLTGVASYHNDRLRTAADGDIFNTITNGKGQMLGYGYNIAVDDRWRIVMYVRALQRSQSAPLVDATTDEMADLDKTRKPAAPAPAPAPGPAATPAPSLPAAGGQPAAPDQSQPGNGRVSPNRPGQPHGPVAPAPTGSPSPTVAPGATENQQKGGPTNQAAPAQPAGSASTGWRGHAAFAANDERLGRFDRSRILI